MCASWSGPNRWAHCVQYRAICAQCEEYKTVAVIPWHGDRVRLCEVCWKDNFWKERLRSTAAKEAASHAASSERREPS